MFSFVLVIPEKPETEKINHMDLLIVSVDRIPPFPQTPVEHRQSSFRQTFAAGDWSGVLSHWRTHLLQMLLEQHGNHKLSIKMYYTPVSLSRVAQLFRTAFSPAQRALRYEQLSGELRRPRERDVDVILERFWKDRKRSMLETGGSNPLTSRVTRFSALVAVESEPQQSNALGCFRSLRAVGHKSTQRKSQLVVKSFGERTQDTAVERRKRWEKAPAALPRVYFPCVCSWMQIRWAKVLQ